MDNRVAQDLLDAWEFFFNHRPYMQGHQVEWINKMVDRYVNITYADRLRRLIQYGDGTLQSEENNG